MRALIVLAHPEPASFNGGMKDVAVTTLTGLGHGVEVSDLYAMAFDPVEGPGPIPCDATPTASPHRPSNGTPGRRARSAPTSRPRSISSNAPIC